MFNTSQFNTAPFNGSLVGLLAHLIVSKAIPLTAINNAIGLTNGVSPTILTLSQDSETVIL